MASIIYEQATAPGFSGSAASPWSLGTTPLYKSWINAITRYVAQAKTILNNSIVDWTPDGITHTGLTVPATPSNETISAGACGAGQSVYALLDGNRIINTYYFFDKNLTKEYRWVQDVAPIGAGDYEVYRATPSSGNPYDLSDVLYGYILGITGPTQNGVAAAANAAAQAMIGFVYANPDSGYYNMTVSDVGVDTSRMFIKLNGISVFSFSGNTIRPVANPVDGQWHEEYRTTNPVRGVRCERADYISSSDPNWSPAVDPGKTKVKMDSSSGLGTIGAAGPLVNIGNLCGTGFPTTSVDQALVDALGVTTIPDYVIEGKYHPGVELSYTTPGANFLVQQGSPFSSYSDIQGMYVLDLYLNKWGKCAETFSLLIDYMPLNNPSYNVFSTTDLGMTAGILKATKLKIFDTRPVESEIRYGKIGYQRLGVEHLLETRLHFRREAFGSITIEPSLDGRNIDTPTIYSMDYVNARYCVAYPNIRYKWYNVVIRGEYDLQYMETRGNISGRR